MYLGTSALDGAKPTATYILDMLTQRYGGRFGEDCFRNCDVVDMTFACIGAVDALHRTLIGSPEVAWKKMESESSSLLTMPSTIWNLLENTLKVPAVGRC